MKIKRYIGFLMFMLAGQCLAQTTILGPTGSVKIPSADSLDFMDFAISFHAFEEKEPGGIKQKQNIAAATVGLQNGFEVGLGRWEQRNQEDQLILHAKWQFRKETKTSPAVAIGALFFPNNDQNRGFNDLSLYAVASQGLTFPKPFAKLFSMRGHVGIGKEFYDGAFYGVDLEVSENLKFSVEYDSHQINGKGSFFVAPGIAIQGTVVKENFGLGLQVVVKK